MSTNIEHNFKFVIFSGNAYNAVTSSCLEEDYRTTMLIHWWPLPPKGFLSDINKFIHIQDDTRLQLRVDTHDSLRSRGANALALSGYSDTQIQKMGRWKGTRFKEYIREELACYSAGMSSNSKMKRNFKFVNISGTAYNDVTGKCLEEDYNINLSMAAVKA
jgi:hypothetical protein